MNLPAELTRLPHMQGAGNVIFRFRRNLERRCTLRTEAGIHASAVSQPDDAHHLVRRVGEGEEDFPFGFGVDVVEFIFFLVERTQWRRQRIVMEPASEGEHHDSHRKK